jgi:hypothetical protein
MSAPLAVRQNLSHPGVLLAILALAVFGLPTLLTLLWVVVA